MKVRKLPKWNAQAERGLADVLRGEGEEIARQVDAGVAELFAFDDETYMVTRWECSETLPDELVVCCLQGRGLDKIAPWVINLARANGIESMRFHTQRPGLGRVMRRYGFRELERVYRLDLRN